MEGTNGGVKEKEKEKKVMEEERRRLLLVCENNTKDRGYCGNGGEGSSIAKNEVAAVLDEDVDVVGIVEGEKVARGVEKRDDPDATENSSSFGNTFSGSNDERVVEEDEVCSQFSLENGEQPVVSEGFGRLFRRKKVTAHWKRFISPLMWRCQWLELRMNELRSQARVYDKQLEAYKHEKQLQSKMIELDDSVSKSVPLTCQGQRKRVMKRMKRKRNEDTLDVSSYVANHSIFSYYENKKSETDGHSVDDVCDDQAIEDIIKGNVDPDWSALGVRRDDDSLEKILLQIEGLQSSVHSMQAQLSKVMPAGNFFHRDPPTGYVQSHSLSPVNINGDSMTLHHGDDSVVSSYRDAADIDIIENTVGLLTGDGSMTHADFFNDIPDDFLISNQSAGDQELRNFQRINYGKEKLQEIDKEDTQSCSDDSRTPSPPPRPIPVTVGESSQPPVPIRSYSGKKRGRKPKAKRNRRGAPIVSGSRSKSLKRRRYN